MDFVVFSQHDSWKTEVADQARARELSGGAREGHLSPWSRAEKA